MRASGAMSILAERELTEEERAAVADEPRPGVWIEDDEEVTGGDGKRLTQHETDALIRAELLERWDPDDEDLAGVLGEHGDAFEIDDMCTQRGGIHSDPLVRLVAYRVWGDRDRAWRTRDTARALIGEIEYEYLSIEDPDTCDACRRAYGFTAARVTSTGAVPIELVASRDGEKATATRDDAAVAEAMSSVETFLALYLDLFDEVDRKLRKVPTSGTL